MLSVGSVAVKAKVIALYAVVLSNANHRRQNVRRGEANRVCGLTAPLLNPIPLSSLYLTASVYIYIFRSTDCEIPRRHFLSNFTFAEMKGEEEKFFRHEYGYEYG